MSIYDWLTVAAVIICLLISAFYSGSETALTASSRAAMLRLEKHGNVDATIVSRLLAQRDHPIEDRFPVLVAGKIVIGDEKLVDALRHAGPHHALHVIGVAVPRLAALDIDDGAKAALEGTTPAGVAGGIQQVASDHVARQQRTEDLEAARTSSAGRR